MIISLVVAAAENGVIGRAGTVLPWHLPADLAHFKQITLGHPIIMGRKTYETIGRPLPDRLNLIITRQRDFTATGCTVVRSLFDAFSQADATGTDETFVIGGGEIFQAALPTAARIYLTRVHAEIEGDTYFHFNAADWQETAREDHPSDEKNEYSYSFLTLKHI